MWDRVPKHRTFHEVYTLLPRRLNQDLRIPRVHRHWLLAQHMLPRRNSVQCILEMEDMGRPNIHNIYLGIAIHPGVRRIHCWFLRRAMRRGEARAFIDAGRSNGADQVLCGWGGSRDHEISYKPGGDVTAS